MKKYISISINEYNQLLSDREEKRIHDKCVAGATYLTLFMIFILIINSS